MIKKNISAHTNKAIPSNIDQIINYAEIANGLSKDEVSEPYLIIEKDYDEREKRLIEKETYGFYITNHPSSAYQNSVAKIEKINTYFDKQVNMVLVVEDIRTFKTKKDENMASINASDETGSIDLVFFPSNYNLINNVNVGDVILVKGTVGKRYNDYQLIVRELKRNNK